jgi:hypothetical protein
MAELGREPGSGLLGMPDNLIEIHRAIIISLAARNNIPAVYQTPVIDRDGGLLSYGADFQDIKLMQRREFLTFFGGGGVLPMRRAARRKSPATGSCRR